MSTILGGFLSSVYVNKSICFIKVSWFQRKPRTQVLFFAAVLLTCVATPAKAQVAAEFRTAPRSLIVDKLDRSQIVPTTGALSRTAGQYEDLGKVSDSLLIEHVQILLRRPVERQAAFDAFVEALHTKGSPSYHRWLAPASVGEEFGPSSADLATVRSFLESEGFAVNYVGTGGFYIDFTGTAAQLQHAFHTELHNYKLLNGETAFAATRQASIPAALAPAVAGVVSLSTIHTAVMNHEKRVAPASSAASGTAGGVAPQDDPVLSGTTYYAVGPQDFYKIYSENSVLSGGTTGSGVTIALLEETNINTADVTTFRTTYNVVPNAPPSLVVEHGYGANTCNNPGITSKGEESEAILDTEWAGAVAPGANLLFMSCPVGTNLGVVYSAEAVVDNNLADIMSLSYGDYEGDTAYGNVDALIANLWEQAASQGETVVVSAGDSGPAVADGNLGNRSSINGVTANLYSSTAWNVSAGGTDFMDTYNGGAGDPGYGNSKYWAASDSSGKLSALSYIPEMPWNDTCASSVYNAYYFYPAIPAAPTSFCGTFAKNSTNAAVSIVAGSGGPSVERARPAWQAPNAVYGIPASTGTNAFRLQPDVSLFAADGLWAHFLEYYQSDDAVNDYAGGTSFVAPQLAGLFALIKQSTGERLGQPDYVLYDMAAIEYGSTSPTNACNGSGASGTGTTASTPSSSCIFYDVQVGNNSVTCGPYRAAYVDCDRLSTAKTYGILDSNGNFTADNTDPIIAYSTGTGYDMATGLGSVNIANLISNWQSQTQGALFTPTVALTPATTTYTYGAPPASITYKSIVSGSGSLPTGTVSFSGSPIIGAIGSPVTLVPVAACSTGGTVGTGTGNCYESASQTYAPSATAVSAGSYTITASYAPPATNENYVAGSGTASIVVNKQLPGLSVTAPTSAVTYNTANVTITAKLTFTGSGLLPTTASLVSFQVGSLGTYTATCSGTSSPITCSYVLPLGTAVSSGTYAITAQYAGDVNYGTVSASGTLTYGIASTIAGFAVASPQHTMYPTISSPAATSNSNGAFTYSVLSGPATYQGLVSGKPTFQLTGTGSVTVKVYQAAATGSQTYTPTFITSTFSVIAGSIWVGDGSNAVSTFDLLGNAIAGSGNGVTGGGIAAIATPLGEAFDRNGFLWVASAAGVSEFSFPNPAAVNATPITSGGISAPVSLAIDGNSQIWVANNNGTISVLSNTGANLSPATGYTYSGVNSATSSIAVDVSGNVWVSNNADSSVTEVIGAAVPAAPPAAALAAGTTGATP